MIFDISEPNVARDLDSNIVDKLDMSITARLGDFLGSAGTLGNVHDLWVESASNQHARKWSQTQMRVLFFVCQKKQELDSYLSLLFNWIPI